MISRCSDFSLSAAGFNPAVQAISHHRFTQYFLATRIRADRAVIKDEWIQFVIDNPIEEVIQADGRIKRWARIAEMGNRVLRVVLLDDGETVHNAFFDRSFKG